MGAVIPQVVTEDRASGAQVIDGSLKFDDDTNTYLTRTPSSAGNRRTFTIAFWCKRASFVTMPFLQANPSTNPYLNLAFVSDVIRVLDGANSFKYETDGVFRDTGWYHVVLAIDTTQSVEADRVKIYVNGVSQDITITKSFTQNYETQVNATTEHRIGRWLGTSNLYWDGNLSNYYFIDGQALGPGYFGFTDPLTNTWRPKKFRAEGTTVNDGTVWSNFLTTNAGDNFDASGPKVDAFDGDPTDKCFTANNADGTTAGTSYIQFNSPVPINGYVEMYVDNGNAVYSVDSLGNLTLLGKNTSGSDNQRVNLGYVQTSKLRVLMEGGSRPAIGAIFVDGVIMVDSTTQNLDFGTNGFYLPMDGNSPIGEDKSGKGNNWTANGFTGTFSNPDVVPDSPSGVVGSTKPTSGITTTSSITKPTNYATLNPLSQNATNPATLSDGNLKCTTNTTARFQSTSNMSMSSGKWYCEIDFVSTSSDDNIQFGVADYNHINLSTVNGTISTSGGQAVYYRGYEGNKRIYTNGTAASSAFGDTYSTGNTIGIAFDADRSEVYFYKDGVLQDSAISFPSTNYEIFFVIATGSAGVRVANSNFGQRPFKFQPPAGYLTLCSANVRPSTVIPRPDQYVGIVTYSGSGSTRNVSGLNFSPDLVIIKDRSTTNNVLWSDTVRRPGRRLISNLTNADATDTDRLSAFTSDGFTVGNAPDTNDNSSSNYYVGWAWKAGGGARTLGVATSFYIDDVGYATTTAAGLTSGNLTGASIGTKQGFSIIQYTGNSTGSNAGSEQELSHNMGKAPAFVIAKNLDKTHNWNVLHHKNEPSGIAYYRNALYLNQRDAAPNTDNVRPWGGVAPTSSIITVSNATTANSQQSLNYDGDNYILYMWAEIPGFSKFGSYVGNGSPDGPMIVTGFKPRWVMIKSNTTALDWCVFDTSREGYNAENDSLYLNDNNSENYYVLANEFDILSNGFKPRANRDRINQSGDTYIYAAFAEAPSSNLYGGGANAR